MPGNLPPPRTSFVGRSREQLELGHLLERSRCVTVTGAGGCGKTRLALRVAAARSSHYPDGVWWVDLARLEDGGLLASAVIEAVGLEEIPGLTPKQTLLQHFRHRRALLILDNCEHLLSACAGLVDSLLVDCASLSVLATSRAPLGLPGEATWRVPSMSLPRTDPLETGSIQASDALSLFRERAAQVRHDFEVSGSNVDSVARICRELDGIPLAIELAAARIRMMAPEQIANGLADRFHLLSESSAAVLSRHQTLEQSISWSYALLSDAERMAARRLSVFSGGWTLEAAESVCAGGPILRRSVLNLLGSLVDQSLVTVIEQGSQMRYGMLETVRQFLAARLAESGEEPQVRDQHLAYHLALAEETEPHLLGAARNDDVMRRVADELPNFRSAMEWAAARKPEAALRIAVALSLFWLFTGRFREGETAYRRSLEAGADAPEVFRARCLAARAHLAQHAGSFEAAQGWAEAAMALGREGGDAWAQGRALNTLGRALSFRDPGAGRSLLERSLENANAAGDNWCRVSTTQALAIAWNFQEEFDQASPILETGYEEAVRFGYRRGVAIHWWCLGWQAAFQGRLEKALQLLDRSVAASEEVGDPFPNGLARSFRAFVLTVRGEWEAARRCAQETLESIRRSGAGLVTGIASRMLASTEIALGDFSAARANLTSAVRLDAGFPWARSAHLAALATLDRLEGNAREALVRAVEALEVARVLGSPAMQAGAELVLGRLAFDAGRVGEGQERAQRALGHLSEKGIHLLIPDSFDLLGLLAAARQSHAESARLLGAASAARQRMGTVRFPPEQKIWEEASSNLRKQLGSMVYTKESEAGAAIATADAVAYARRARGNRKRPPTGWDSLTPTEVGIVRLAAAGMTNAQIAEQMFVARGTVKVHLSHIFSKLQVSSRAELASLAARKLEDPG
ncbi:MAG TPA: LuxR C-terminal-related transcriptional regulator [Actinomycetota bacterium]|nr:LuxR C-terminal-related transcriptional regulator [Actinomycetota bacterium]